MGQPSQAVVGFLKRVSFLMQTSFLDWVSFLNQVNFLNRVSFSKQVGLLNQVSFLNRVSFLNQVNFLIRFLHRANFLNRARFSKQVGLLNQVNFLIRFLHRANFLNRVGFLNRRGLPVSEGRLEKDSVGLARMVALSHAEQVVADSPELLAAGQVRQAALQEAGLVIRRLPLEECSAESEDQGSMVEWCRLVAVHLPRQWLDQRCWPEPRHAGDRR